jgi:hypothetical protein
VFADEIASKDRKPLRDQRNQEYDKRAVDMRRHMMGPA